MWKDYGQSIIVGGLAAAMFMGLNVLTLDVNWLSWSIAGLMFAGCVGFLVLTYPTLMLMSVGNFFAATVAMVLLGVFMAAFDGASSAAMAELFPTNIRYGSMAIAYNFSVAIFGGITPYFATWLIAATGNTFAPAFYVMAAALITLITVLRARETFRKPLEV